MKGHLATACTSGSRPQPDKTEQHAEQLIEAKREILKLRSQLRRTQEERIKKRIYKTRDLARVDVFDYIEMFYDRTRCSRSIQASVTHLPVTASQR